MRGAMLGLGLLVLVVGTSAACGPPAEDRTEGRTEGRAGDATTAPPAPSPPLSTTPPPTLPRRTSPPTSPTDAVKPRTVRGVVVPSVRPDCVELLAGTVRYVLVGKAAADLAVGDAVEVVGLPVLQRETGCDGTALLVRSLTHS